MKLFNYIKTHPMTIMLGFVFSLAFFGIACAIISFYGLNGFDLKWFVFFHLPLYIFCGWALYQSFKMAFKIIDHEHGLDIKNDTKNDTQNDTKNK